MQKVTLKYGLIAGGIMAVFFVISWIVTSGDSPNYGMSEVIGYAAMILSLSVIFMALKEYRALRAPAGMSVWQGFQVGLVISLIAALIFVVVDTAYITWVDPQFAENYANYQVGVMEANGASNAEIEAMKQQMQAYSNPLFMEAIMFVTVWVIGMIISLIAALVMQQKGESVAA